MATEPRVRQLLEEILDSDRTPEEVCHDCPELLSQVREGLRRVRAVEVHIDSIFPTLGSNTFPPEPTDAGPPRLPRYEIQAVLGRGGMGVVYKAWDRRLNRPVALKMLLAGTHARPEEVERFLRGAEAEAGLRHANIVQVYDVGDLDGRPYFTMEYVEGGSLAQRLSGVPLPARRAADLLATLADAVQAAHDGGVVHRDLKPANVLLAEDGTPKITDFGLARRLEEAPGLTHSGATVGTPSYMAPEQAQGKTRAIGSASDVYALGAILYETLTGQPPFKADSALETMRQVIEQEPTPPSRCNPKLARDLETICLKCLHKDPHKRYASAALLGDDLQRFQRGEAITARPESASERLGRWLKRRWAPLAVLAGCTLLGIGLIADVLWIRSEHAAIVERVEDDLFEVAHQRQRLDWGRATIALERALARLGRGGPAPLRQRIDQARAELDQARREHLLLTQLDAIHLNRATFIEGRYNRLAERHISNARADREYEAAFREAGFGVPADDPARVAARIASSAARQALVAALDDWAVSASDERRQAWVLEAARKADPDTWRDRIRDPAAWRDREVLAELARTAPAAEQPVSIVLALGERLHALGQGDTAFLARVQQARPADFWANLTLAHALQERDDLDTAITYYEQALKARRHAVVHNNLGLIWYKRFFVSGAMDRFQEALRIDPRFAAAHNNFGLLLKAKGELDEAVGHYREAQTFEPELAPPHANLGEVLADRGQLDEAIDCYREALRIEPDYARAHYHLGVALTAKSRLEQVNQCREQALRNDPVDARAHDQIYGLAVGQAVEHFQHARRIDPRFTISHNGLGISPGDTARLNEAIGHYERALQIDPALEEPDAALGQALLALGRFGEAKAATRRCLDRLPQGHELVANVSAQLRRCERLLALQDRLPAMLQGKDKPADAAETLEFAELCAIKSQFVAAARLYADGFAASPQLADDLRAGHRYRAACAAILAGSVRGDGAAELDETARASWRARGRQWLRADLTLLAIALDNGSGGDRDLARRILAHLWCDPDLASLHDPDSLDKLSRAEREECRALWSDLDVLMRRV